MKTSLQRLAEEAKTKRGALLESFQIDGAGSGVEDKCFSAVPVEIASKLPKDVESALGGLRDHNRLMEENKELKAKVSVLRDQRKTILKKLKK
eukprot:CAMPEP_0114535210 /NCGR_PEP_ID=MMETSP0109-20121206/28291_1 /TAXON_ID=29199 /ORGANISM="Chlorarachnion reptans, Strain CCCM449" /LENGTH=92 /DNA_ID=CAMNT_0001718753 /DNA_START=1 /DNA_END=276 /DNA_ORIENTATION=+